MSDPGPDHDTMEAALRGVDAEIGAAEAHGLLAGMASATAEPEASRWIAQVLAGTEPRGAAARECLEQLTALFRSTLDGLEDSDLAFHLLVPDESASLAHRAEALGAWAHGFIYGLGVAGIEDESRLPKEVAEIIGHLGEVTQAVSDGDGEDDESAYTELLEFVRTAALLVREHLQPRRRSAPVPVPGAGAGGGND